MDWLLDSQVWFGLIGLSVLEIVLGIDNLVFLAILTDRLPEDRRPTAERLGLAFALLARLALLAGMVWAVGLAQPMVEILGRAVSWRDIVLISGGIFLLAKATHEIHGALEGEDDEDDEGHHHHPVVENAKVWTVVLQMGLLDLVFSLDSVVTAIGMVNQLWVMATAVVLALVLMLAAAAPLSGFLARHPTLRILALAFLMMIGLSLVAEGLGVHVPKDAIYFAMGFAAAVECLNLLARRRRKPVRLRHPLP